MLTISETELARLRMLGMSDMASLSTASWASSRCRVSAVTWLDDVVATATSSSFSPRSCRDVA